MKSIAYYLKNPKYLAYRIVMRTAKFYPDKFFLQLRYWFTFGKWLDLKNPQTFNEKIQWLKLYNRKPEYTMMVDKYAVKEYVANKIGHEFIIRTLGVWEKPEDIPFDKLPNQFVLKTTHGGGGGGIIICKDKSIFNIPEAVAKLKRAMKSDIYTYYREWPYKNVTRRIIAEKFIQDENGYELKDYKLFCFDGKVQFCKVDFDRFEDHHANYYSPTWSILPFGEANFAPKFEKQIECPVNFNEMLRLANKLSQGIPFARIDFYSIKGRSYFGEITFFPASGMGEWTPVEADEHIGKMLNLPNIDAKFV